MRISDFIYQSNTAGTPEDLFSDLEQAAQDTGFNWIAYTHLSCYEPVPHLKQVFPSPAVFLHYPPKWIKRYFRRNYQEIDPVVLYTPRIRNPYLWKDITDFFPLNELQVGFMEIAKEAGLRTGITIPLHGPWGSVAAVSYACKESHPDATGQMSKLYLLAAQFHTCFMDLTRKRTKNTSDLFLTGREQDCLKWVAQGKSSWEISTILGIQKDTVNFYMKNAFRKLNVSTRAMAVLKAVRLGLINL